MTKTVWAKAQRQQLRERVKRLDVMPPRAGETLRLAFVGTPDSEADTQALLNLAYELGRRGAGIWVVSHAARPQRDPEDFADLVHWVAADPAGPLVESLPPVELFVATRASLCSELYLAGRPFAYLHFDAAPLPDSDLSLMPSRLLAASGGGAQRLTAASGRPVTSLPTDIGEAVEVLAGAHAACLADPLRNSRPRVSLCMIAKNEAERILKCITSVYGVADEVCLVDTGSTDDTVALAERAGARVEIHPWQDDFALHRNQSLAMATGDWVLHLDADEELMPETRKAIPELVRKTGPLSFLMPVDSIMPGGMSRVYISRLFRREPGAAFSGRIHENIGPWLNRLGGKLEVVHTPILHHGYKEDPMRATGKRSRNRGLLLKALEENPGDPWYQYYLAAEEFLAGEPQVALEILRNLSPHTWLEGQPGLLEISCYHMMGDWSRALAAAKAAVRKYPQAMAPWAQLAKLGYALDDLGACREALGVLRTNDRLIGSPELAQVTVDYFSGCMADDKQVAAQHWRKCLRQNDAVRALFRYHVRTGSMADALKAFSQLPLQDGGVLPTAFQALVDLQDWAGALRLLELYPQERPHPGVGSLFWTQGHPEEAIRMWREAGGAGWLRYGIVAALFGDASDLEAVFEHVSPLEALALGDLQQGNATWRLATLVPELMNMGCQDLVEAVVTRAPFLAESVRCHYRVHVAP